MQHLCKNISLLHQLPYPLQVLYNMNPKLQKLEKRFTSPCLSMKSRKKEVQKSKKRIAFTTLLSGDAFKLVKRVEIQIKRVSKTIDPIHLKLKMPNTH